VTVSAASGTTEVGPKKSSVRSGTGGARSSRALYGAVCQMACVIEQHGGRPAIHSHGENTMLHWSLIFLIIAIVAAVFGFGGIAGTAAGIAKILFFVFLVIWLLAFVVGRRSI
jgi:uncharacterized membrane protein YtjA (UPF0391 family)